ncbi:acyltransferase family protein [Niabella insulamsoli]|uniref:acyltransferase family protein n=1 Tax=Niabella insulamsoli TaxID=3144874 RepID=UPI0031FDBA30
MNLRYRSLDIFRGATVCLMILVNNPGSWGHIYGPLKHAPWHGLTPTDLVFPFFLFAVGNAMAFVIPKLKTAGTAFFWRKVIKRTLIIFGIGLFLNWYPFLRWHEGSLEFIGWVNQHNPEKGVRIFGVLQRIAVCYFFASVIAYFLKPRAAWFVSLLLLLVYWIVCVAGNPIDPYSLEGWVGTGIDKAMLGLPHMYRGEGVPFDPEGLLSTVPAIVEVILGYFVGSLIKNNASADDPNAIFKTLTTLFVAGLTLVVTGLFWDLTFPINKKIWTSSYTVYTVGLATLTLSVMIYLVEIKNYKGFPTRFFEVFGKNPLFIFALSAFLPKTAALFTSDTGVNFWNWFYKKIYIHIPGDPRLGSFLYALTVIIFMWAICYWLDKKKIYIKV